MTAVATLSALGRAAVQYASRGLLVAPQYPSRAFAFEGWIEKASNDPIVIEEWWSRWPGLNPACVLGRSGLAVVDVDAHDGGADGFAALDAAQERLGALPATATVRTGGGGMHLWFKCDVQNARSVIVQPGLEVKSGRCGTPLPPSLHRSGRRYEWIDRTSAATLPAAWRALILPPPPPPPRPARQVCSSSSYGRAAIRSEAGKVLCAACGTRNKSLRDASYALGQLVGAGLVAEDEVVSALLDAGAAVGLPIAEARSVVRRGVRAGAARPRQVRTLRGASCW